MINRCKSARIEILKNKREKTWKQKHGEKCMKYERKIKVEF